MATFYITLFIRYISVNISALIWVGFGLNVLCVICSYWLIESPAWLLSIGDK